MVIGKLLDINQTVGIQPTTHICLLNFSIPVTSSGNELLVVFTTDHNMEMTGFSMNYWQEGWYIGNAIL